MASQTVLLFLAIISLTLSVGGQNIMNPDLRCYLCELENSSACGNQVDTSTLPVVDCKNFKMPSPRVEEARTITDQMLLTAEDGKFRGGPIINEILHGNGTERSQPALKNICIRVTLTADDLKSTVRTCEKVPVETKNPCKYITEQIGSQLKVHDCYACEKDKCNSATVSFVSSFIVSVCAFLIILPQF